MNRPTAYPVRPSDPAHNLLTMLTSADALNTNTAVSIIA